MFRSALSVATRGLRTRGVRNFSDAAAFPKKGLAEGGHPNVLQKEGNWKKTWFGEAAAYPIIVITGFACSFAFYKVCIYDALSPDAHVRIATIPLQH